MNCKDCQIEIPEYADGTTSPEVRLALESHLAVCDACATALTRERSAVSKFHSLLDQALDQQRLAPAARGRIATAGGSAFRPANPCRCAWFAPLAAAAALLLLASASMIVAYPARQTAMTTMRHPAPAAPSNMSDLTNALCLLAKTSCLCNSSENLVVNTARRVSW